MTGLDLVAFLVPSLFLNNVGRWMRLEEGAIGRCFVMLCAAVLLASLAADLLALAVLRPWLDRDADFGVYFALGAATIMFIFVGAIAAEKSVAALCGGAKSPSGGG